MDKSKYAYLKKMDGGSWTVLRFWESDIKKDVGKCVDEIEKALKRCSPRRTIPYSLP
jgi:very-short-patch-repair endonuclease